jgi:putative ABC transport system permease protein
MTGFPLIMAWRETRTTWRHCASFCVGIPLGVGILVAISLFATHVEQAVTREARGLMGGDLEIRLSHPLSEQGALAIESLTTRGIAVLHVSELVGMAATVDSRQRTQLVELKAVESRYPFYGQLRVEPARPLMELLAPLAIGQSAQASSRQRAPGYGAVVQQSLLVQLGLAVGDRFKVGEAVFTITGILRREPDRVVGPFTLGPRVMISREGLTATALMKPGSRVRERYLLKLPPSLHAQAVIEELRNRLRGESARILSYRDAQPQLKAFLDQLTRYLGLIGLTALFIGGIGVATTIHAFIQEKLETIAILKALGADSRTVMNTYLLQTLLLGTVGSLVGAVLGAGVEQALPPLVSDLFGADLLEQLGFSIIVGPSSIWPVLKGVALGLLTTLMFALWPLLAIREVRPTHLVRRTIQTHAHPPAWQERLGLTDRARTLTALAIGTGLAGLAVWVAGTWQMGLLFIAALITAVTLLALGAWVVTHTLKVLPSPHSLAIRYAIRNLCRPGSQTFSITISVGIGVMVIMAVSLVERTLVRQVLASRPVDTPSFFLIDIQPDQTDALIRLLSRHDPSSPPTLTPLVRSRLRAINGRPVSLPEEQEGRLNEPDRRTQWYLSREYVLTFLYELPRGNTVIKGEWWKPDHVLSKPLVSIEEDAARHLGVDVGSSIEFDVQGKTVTAQVSSIRRVEWVNFSTNFYMILSPGSLDDVPRTYVATVRVPPEQEIPLQQAVVAAFPNVTAINVGDVLESVVRILDRLARAIRTLASGCILAGLVVMAAALAVTRYRRLYEAAVLKALGAPRGLLLRSFAMEYALLGMVAGTIGTGLAHWLAWALTKWLFETATWTLQWDLLAVGLALTVGLCLLVGLLSTLRILNARPLPALRQE